VRFPCMALDLRDESDLVRAVAQPRHEFRAGTCVSGGATDDAAEHVARLGWTRRELARAVGCSLRTASRLSRPGNRVRREFVERVLALPLRTGGVRHPGLAR
jgi:hypothetical protein